MPETNQLGANAHVMSGTPEIAPGCVALTFDDGPGPKSAQLAKLLADEGIVATFFVLGESLERYGDVLETHRAYGHAIALHSEYHRPFTSVELAKSELDKCRARVEKHLPSTVWFRPPYGIGDESVEGYAGPVGWHAHGRDWEITYRQGQTVEGAVDEIMANLAPTNGGIVLLHDFAPYTEFTHGGLTEGDLDLRVIEVTTLLIQRVREAGMRFVALPAAQSA